MYVRMVGTCAVTSRRDLVVAMGRAVRGRVREPLAGSRMSHAPLQLPWHHPSLSSGRGRWAAEQRNGRRSTGPCRLAFLWRSYGGLAFGLLATALWNRHGGLSAEQLRQQPPQEAAAGGVCADLSSTSSTSSNNGSTSSVRSERLVRASA